MKKPARLELNNSGAWKLMGKFDAAEEDATDAIMNAAEALAQALNDPACKRPGLVSLRISTDEQHPLVLMSWTQSRGTWVDAAGEPA